MSQIIKTPIDITLLYDFLKSTGYITNNYIIINNSSYKKIKYNNILYEIINKIKPYYHKSKQFYLTRNITYKNFLTVLRQVCNYLCIPYTSKIIYNCSKYNIIYIFYLDDILNNEQHQNSENTKIDK